PAGQASRVGRSEPGALLGKLGLQAFRLVAPAGGDKGQPPRPAVGAAPDLLGPGKADEPLRLAGARAALVIAQKDFWRDDYETVRTAFLKEGARVRVAAPKRDRATSASQPEDTRPRLQVRPDLP